MCSAIFPPCAAFLLETPVSSWLLKDLSPVRYKQQLLMQDLQDREKAGVGRAYCYSGQLIRRRFNSMQAVSTARSSGTAYAGR